MMYRTIEEFIAEWEQEAAITERTLRILNDESLGQSIAEGYRTLGDIAWHLVQSVYYMASLGLDLKAPEGGSTPPASAKRIADEYGRIASELVVALRQQWTDASLSLSAIIEGQEWQNGASLKFTILHQAHHRGQLSVLIRQAGLRLTEIYGPTKDDWMERGKEPLA